MGMMFCRCVGGTASGFYVVTHMFVLWRFTQRSVRAVHVNKWYLESGGCWLSPWKLQKEAKQPESRASIYVESQYLNRLWTDCFEIKLPVCKITRVKLMWPLNVNTKPLDPSLVKNEACEQLIIVLLGYHTRHTVNGLDIHALHVHIKSVLFYERLLHARYIICFCPVYVVIL